MDCIEIRDRQRNRITLDEYVDLFKDDHYRFVIQSLIDDYYVSTVWLGIPHVGDHGFDYYFETMVFREPTDYEALDCVRYRTEKEALVGHEKLCENVRRGVYEDQS